MTAKRACFLTGVLALSCSYLTSCNRSHRPHGGEQLAHFYCAACHAFPEPYLLDKKTWLEGVLPQMAPRLGVPMHSLSDEMSMDPKMSVLTSSISEPDWESIVSYYCTHAPNA